MSVTLWWFELPPASVAACALALKGPPWGASAGLCDPTLCARVHMSVQVRVPCKQHACFFLPLSVVHDDYTSWQGRGDGRVDGTGNGPSGTSVKFTGAPEIQLWGESWGGTQEARDANL